MPVRTLFATNFYEAGIGTPGLIEDLEDSCRLFAEEDGAGKAWSREHGYRGYTSYASLGDLPEHDPAFHDLKRLASSSVVYGLGNVVARGLSFLLLPLYTRHLTPADYGVTGVCMSVQAVLVTALTFGLHGALTPLYWEAKDETQRRATNGTIAISAVIAITTSTATCCHDEA